MAAKVSARIAGGFQRASIPASSKSRSYLIPASISDSSEAGKHALIGRLPIAVSSRRVSACISCPFWCEVEPPLLFAEPTQRIARIASGDVIAHRVGHCLGEQLVGSDGLRLD